MSAPAASLRDWRAWRERLATAVLGAVFLAAGLAKSGDLAAFLQDLASFRAFPPGLAALLVYFVPALEMTAGAAVLWRRSRRAGAAVLLGLPAAFIVLLAVSWARGLDITCGCFGGGTGEANYPLLLGRNAILLALAAWVFFSSRNLGSGGGVSNGGAPRPTP